MQKGWNWSRVDVCEEESLWTAWLLLPWRWCCPIGWLLSCCTVGSGHSAKGFCRHSETVDLYANTIQEVWAFLFYGKVPLKESSIGSLRQTLKGQIACILPAPGPTVMFLYVWRFPILMSFCVRGKQLFVTFLTLNSILYNVEGATGEGTLYTTVYCVLKENSGRFVNTGDRWQGGGKCEFEAITDRAVQGCPTPGLLVQALGGVFSARSTLTVYIWSQLDSCLLCWELN